MQSCSPRAHCCSRVSDWRSQGKNMALDRDEHVKLHMTNLDYWYMSQYNSTYDPDISPGSANQCILGDVYLRSNVSKKT